MPLHVVRIDNFSSKQELAEPHHVQQDAGPQVQDPKTESDQGPAEDKKANVMDQDENRNLRNRKMLSSCASIEPWLLEQFPLDSKDVVLVHVKHKTSMLPHFQIRLTSNASHDGKILGCYNIYFSK